MPDKHTVSVEIAPQIAIWMHDRGGIAIWSSVDLSDLNFSLTTPMTREDGSMMEKPHWKVGNAPSRIITDPTEIEVVIDEEVKRFRVALRMSGNGLSLKVTNGGTRRIRSEVAKAGAGAYYKFDYNTQQAVIMKPLSTEPFIDWLKKNYSK